MSSTRTLLIERRTQSEIGRDRHRGDHEYLDFARYLGADAVLTKPFQPAELLEAIGSVLSVPSRNENSR